MGRLGSNPRRLFFVSGHCEATGQHHRNELGATVSVPPIQLVRAVGCYRLSRQNHKASLNRNRGGVLRSAKMPQPAILSGITIVLVEDYADTLYGIAHFLRRHGAKVFPRPDAFQGLQAVREHRPDIDLSDIGLPRKTNRRSFSQMEGAGAQPTSVSASGVSTGWTAAGETLKDERWRSARKWLENWRAPNISPGNGTRSERCSG